MCVGGVWGGMFLGPSPASRGRECNTVCEQDPGGKEGWTTNPFAQPCCPSMCKLGPFPPSGRGKKSLFPAKPPVQGAPLCWKWHKDGSWCSLG